MSHPPVVYHDDKEVLEQDAMSQVALPVLEHHVRQHPCQSSSVVFVMHLLDTTVPFVDIVSRTLDVSSMVAIPYSTSTTARRVLGDRYLVHEPSRPSEVGAAARQALRQALRRAGGQSVVLQEVGGYAAPFIHSVAASPGFLGVVEDTKQGHWQYQKLDALPCPVLSIAESPLKMLENRQVGRAIAFAMERILRTSFFKPLNEVVVGVLGYGGIGAATVSSLHACGARVVVYDPDPLRMATAAMDGVDVRERDQVLSAADVVIGVSGQRSLTAEDLTKMKDGVILASGSSKQVEIDVPGLRRAADRLGPRGEVLELDVAGRRAYLVNDGMPVNFSDQSVLGCVLDLVFTELYMCMQKLTTQRCRPGLQELDRLEHAAIAEVWRRTYWSGSRW